MWPYTCPGTHTGWVPVSVLQWQQHVFDVSVLCHCCLVTSPSMEQATGPASPPCLLELRQRLAAAGPGLKVPENPLICGDLMR